MTDLDDLRFMIEDEVSPQKKAKRFGFRTHYVQADGEFGERLTAVMHAWQAMAFALDGWRAFECSKTAAALHESGHCVIDALDGRIPTRASIWPVRELGCLQWIGRTTGGIPWGVDDKTPPEADLKQARSQLAGVVAEALFDPDYRVGSSIDEMVVSMGIVGRAASKLKRDPERLLVETIGDVASRLKRHKRLVREIANELLRKNDIKSRRLEFLLRTVRGSQ